MPQAQRSPHALGKRRASEIVEARQHDDSENTITATINASLAARWVAARFGLTPARAALVVELTGIGINIVPALPALIGGGR